MLVVLMADAEGVSMEEDLSIEVLRYMGVAFGDALSITINTAIDTGLAVTKDGQDTAINIGRFMVTSEREQKVRDAIMKLMEKEGLEQVIAKDLPEEWRTMEAEDEK